LQIKCCLYWSVRLLILSFFLLQANWFDLKQNTSVYVTGLPPDATEAEVLQLFSKCGVVKSADDGRPRVKVYRCCTSPIITSA